MSERHLKKGLLIIFSMGQASIFLLSEFQHNHLANKKNAFKLQQVQMSLSCFQAIFFSTLLIKYFIYFLLKKKNNFEKYFLELFLKIIL